MVFYGFPMVSFKFRHVFLSASHGLVFRAFSAHGVAGTITLLLGFSRFLNGLIYAYNVGPPR